MAEHISKRKLTLKDIAAQIGVSAATVSNAFNRPDQLSVARRMQILNRCKELGYSGPSLTARSLRTGKTGVLGVLLADNLQFNFSDPVATEFLAGIAQALDQQHINLMLLPSCSENYISTQVDSVPDSFIIYGKPMCNDIIERLVQRGKPIVTVDFTLDAFPSIHVDNNQACYEAAQHALRSDDDKALVLGFRLKDSHSVTFANTNDIYSEQESISRRRLEGYKRALIDNGTNLDCQNIWQVLDPESRDFELMLRGALRGDSPPSVLLCMSDRIALIALKVANDLKIKIPQDLRIVGFDGIAQATSKSITTVVQPSREKGRLAAQIALGIEPYQSVELSTELRIGSTS
jgi:DNA-binding LacI/PurR family transcriptional regulator